jgi:hypothetical protein
MGFKRIAGVIGFALLATAAFGQANRDGEPMQGQISFGFDGLDYNSGRTASLGSIDATVRLFPRVTLETLATGGTYFGEALGGGAAYLTWKPDRKSYFTAGGGRNSNTSTTIAWSGSLEAGRTLYQSEHDPVHRNFIRAVETDLNLTERGYSLSPSVHILLVNPTVVVYLPRDWAVALRAGAIHTTLGGSSTWTASGGAKVNITLTRRLNVSPAVAFDSELADILQINNISSREFGGGMHFWLTKNANVGAYYFRVFYGANHLASHSYGASYALRF